MIWFMAKAMTYFFPTFTVIGDVSVQLIDQEIAVGTMGLPPIDIT